MKKSQLPTYVIVAAAVAVVFAVRGGSLSSLLPFAILLACPLMMVFMMRGMNHGGGEDHTGHGCEHDPTRTGEPHHHAS